ncbi:hypothetical protein KP509_12G045300 [Ceratopteris richardii]|uniref:alpha,alpha-trehalose-phosphate synthase (UDP-forming) n=1 Tax=Ceratopteris richardii TaxID=49495 RepID=A0A8T2TRR0_CERRI|nr:hypothetical protein KP509_12G045300 [Ceratopteris richardii]
MSSRSYTNLLDLTGDYIPPTFSKTSKKMSRVMTVPGILSDFRDEDYYYSVHSDATSSISQDRCIVVANSLPINSELAADGKSWLFSRDEDSLLWQLKDGLPEDMEVVYIGFLNCDVSPAQQDEVSSHLLEMFNCVPTFVDNDVRSKFYHGFCKQTLWPLFHYMLPLTPDHGCRFDRALWQAYVSVNKTFASKVMEVITPEDDYVWIHDYHLMLLPTLLRIKCNKVKTGFFLHSPFPSSEIYRTLPVRDELLRSLLNADVIGFHTFDYARHFLSCCSRMLGLEYESRRGYIGLDYYGRNITIKIMAVGIHMGQLQAGLNLSETEEKIAELNDQFKGKVVLLGLDDMDIFKGIGLKLLAFEQLLKERDHWQGKIVMVQIVNPARGRGKDVEEVQTEVYSIVERVNRQFGHDNYTPIILLERPVPFYERLAFYTVSECCIVTAVRDGMNLIPYEYTVSRQGCQKLDARFSSVSEPRKKSLLVISEFIGCSPSLSGAIRVNPWNIEAVADALNMAIKMPEAEKQMRHDKHFKYVSTHDVAYWACSFMGDLERTCKDHYKKRCWAIGFGLNSRVVALDPSFRKLSQEHIVSAYKRTNSRVILLDYDGTVMPQGSINKTPSEEVISMLNTLCSDLNNIVFIVSGRGRMELSGWFSSCKNLGIAAEHGYYLRWKSEEDWETYIPNIEFDWKQVVEPIMKQYTESTDGSYIEAKESAIVWHHRDADPDFGSWQAKELLDHLENVLANEPVAVKSGQQIVEVKPQIA